MVEFNFYNDDGDLIDDVIFSSEELAIQLNSMFYTWQDLDELGYRLIKSIPEADSFQWDYCGGEED